MSGMSKAHARQSSRNKQRGYHKRKDAGFVAKAGRRRAHNIVKDKDGNYIAAPFKARVRVEEDKRNYFNIDWDVPRNAPGRVDYATMV